MTQEQSTAKKPKIESKRNAEKHPLCTVSASGTGLQKNNVLGIYFHRTQADFQHTGVITFGKNGANTNNSTHGHEKINPPIPPSMRKEGEPLSTDNLARLQSLIKFAEKQVNYDYRGCVGDSGAYSTEKVLEKYEKSDNPTFEYAVKKNKNEKEKSNHPDVSIGRCLWYVKIALMQTKYVNGTPGEGLAKNSGKDWPQYDYADKSADRPKVEITYEKVRTYKKKGEAPEIAEKPLLLTQPDLMYTLPGDLIVYEQVDPVDPAAAGHIDIRTYHGFCSDFAWPRTIPALGQSGTKRYQVKAIYRKISDTLAMVRVQAFLRIIREHEAKGYKDPYHALHFDGKEYVMFSDLSTHPYAKTEEDKPAGAYQIKYVTWKGVISATGWPKTFDSIMQDRLAMYLLQARPLKEMPHPRRSALGYIMEGEVEKAVNEIKLWNLFAFLPGGGDQQQMTMTELRGDFDKYVEEATK